MERKLAVIFGGGGFVGRYVAQELLARGCRVRIASRDANKGFALKPLANLGQSQFVAADIRKPVTVARAVAGADIVVNLVGVLKGDFTGLHVKGAENVAKAAAAAGVPTLIHISAIGADPEGPSAYARSKAAGEAAVRAAFPAANILRPSVLFGVEDGFTNLFAGILQALPVVPVLKPNTKFQPLFVADLAKAVANAALDPLAFAGKTFELGGPETLTMLQVYRWLSARIGRAPTLIPLPDFVGAPVATLSGLLPGSPITRDQWLSLSRDSVADPALPGLAALGVPSTPIEAVADAWLVRYRRHGRFAARPA